MAEKHEHVFVEDGDYVHAAGECEICDLHYRDYIKQLRAREAELVEIVEAVAEGRAMYGDEAFALKDTARALLAEGAGQ